MAAATTATAATMAAVLPKLSALLLLKGEEGEDGRGFIVNGRARRDATFLRDEIQVLQRFMEKISLGSSYLHKKQEEDALVQCPMSRELRRLRDLLSDIEDSIDAFVRRCHRATMTAAKAPRAHRKGRAGSGGHGHGPPTIRCAAPGFQVPARQIGPPAVSALVRGPQQ
ncbi:unnamed protein product [Urochloa humidicola]